MSSHGEILPLKQGASSVQVMENINQRGKQEILSYSREGESLAWLPSKKIFDIFKNHYTLCFLLFQEDSFEASAFDSMGLNWVSECRVLW